MNAFRDIDFSGVDPETLVALEELARKRLQLQMILALKEQERLAAERRNVEVSEVNGVLPTRFIQADIYHDWAARERSYEVWNDRTFNRFISRDSPTTFLKYKRKPQVGWTESVPEDVPIFQMGSGDKRFVKRYPANP